MMMCVCLCRSEKVRRSGESLIHLPCMGSASRWWWQPGTHRARKEAGLWGCHLPWRKLRVQMIYVLRRWWNSISVSFVLFFSPSSCASEMEHWLEDIRMAIDLAEQCISPNTDLLSDGLPGNSKPIYYVRQSFFHASIPSIIDWITP